jgi:transcriptional regulator with XRE-family HTH domain
MSDAHIPAMRTALRQHRLNRRLSYERLAAELALSRETVTSFIEGTKEPSELTQCAIEQYLKAQGIEVAA